MTVHASAFVIGRHGVLVRGASGAGKSLLVEDCLYRAATTGVFARWVADDRVMLKQRGDGLIANAVPTIAGKRELRFFGIANVPHLARCRLDLVVDLVPDMDLERLPGKGQTTCPASGEAATIALPLCAVPAGNTSLACHILMQTLRVL